mgnify:CR=1 FL=1
MSRHTELCGIAYAKPGVMIDEVRGKIIQASGQENQRSDRKSVV